MRFFNRYCDRLAFERSSSGCSAGFFMSYCKAELTRTHHSHFGGSVLENALLKKMSPTARRISTIIAGPAVGSKKPKKRIQDTRTGIQAEKRATSQGIVSNYALATDSDERRRI